MADTPGPALNPVSDDHGNVYVDRTGRPIYRASGLYACTTILVAGRLNIPPGDPPAWMQQRFDEGHNLEAVVLERARTRGMTIANMQGEVRQNVGPATIVGHIDGLGYPVPEGSVANSLDFTVGTTSFQCPVMVIDAKAFAQSTWDEWVRGINKGDVWDRFPYYALQMSIYSAAHGTIPFGMAVALKDRTDEDDIKIVDFRLDVFTKPPIPFGKVLARVLEIEALAAKGMEGLPTQCDQRTFPCPYWSFPFHTDAKDKDGPQELTDADIEGGLAALGALATRRLEAVKRVKAAEAEIDALDADILKAAGDKIGNAKVAAHSETVSSVSLYHHGYSTVDWAQMQRDHPAVDKAKYQKTQPSSKVTVKLNPKRATPPANVKALIE